MPRLHRIRRFLRVATGTLTISPREFYRDADLPMHRRFGIALWLLGAVLTALLLPFAAPVARAEPLVGWGATAAILLASSAVTLRLIRRPEVSRLELLAGSLFSICGLAALAWLSGSQAYEVMMILPVVYSATVHPPRRALMVLALGIVLSAALLDATDHPAASDQMIARSLLWLGLISLAIGWSRAVRSERAQLVMDSEAERQRAYSDALTGLGNRRAFDEAMLVELSRAERTGSPLSLLEMDLDDFKRINDVHGHLAGDHVLRSTGDLLAEHCRPPDRWFRWGGDEFTGLYPATDARAAEAVRERLVAELAIRCRRPDGRPLRAELGIAEWRHGLTGDDLIEIADAELLTAKRARGPRRYDSRDDARLSGA